ncbi:plasmid mobilization relaxosome protein MobC [Phenylobacterium sp.]|uniref:plasmid mobilization relaxosome protein MobC n=1 Tax=Phenylobacterium sp. TaxID=1871053 RepID=UPI00120505B5|nr:plasmid mobilization relaxosome protein MobC [Phenylobacterium sp.]THD57514.1 MAG: plasmid mobilization relaxosome protein MobC [Phenylobacterium sp.]
MAEFRLKLPDDLARRFDGWAIERGGRSPAVRRLIEVAVGVDASLGQGTARPALRPVQLTVRLSVDDGQGLDAAARDFGLTPSAWVAALIRRRLRGRPTFCRADELSLFAVQMELRRIGVNVNEIARGLNATGLEGGSLASQLACLQNLRGEIRAQMQAVRQAFAGNLAYWEVGE